MDVKSSTPLTQLSQSAIANNKYKKALKQINKLVNINNSIKKQLIKIQQQYDNLRHKYSDLEDKYQQILQQLQRYQSNTDLPQMGKATISYEQQISQELIDAQNDMRNLGGSLQKPGKQNFSPLSLKAKELENTGTLSEYMDTKLKLEQVQQKLMEKQRQVKTLIAQLTQKNKQNAELYQKYIQISNNLSKVQNQIQIKDTTDINTISNQKNSLQLSLDKQKQLTAKLTKQIQSLKRNHYSVLGTSQQSAASNAKSLNNPIFFGGHVRPPAVPFHPSFYSSAQNSLQSSIQQSQRKDPFSQYYFKKVRDLQEQITKNKKQYSDKKSKYKSQIARLKQEVEQKNMKINQINSFIIKQQSFIQSFYSKQLKMVADKQQSSEHSPVREYEQFYKEYSRQSGHDKQFVPYNSQVQYHSQQQQGDSYKIQSNSNLIMEKKGSHNSEKMKNVAYDSRNADNKMHGFNYFYK